jgi:hypothetical protein
MNDIFVIEGHWTFFDSLGGTLTQLIRSLGEH